MREKGIHTVEVHVAAICYKKVDGKILVLALRRSTKKQIFPGFWEGTGGQVLRGESFDTALKRIVKNEANLHLLTTQPFTTYVIQPDEAKTKHCIPGIRFICEVDDTEATINKSQHTEHRWLEAGELDSVNWIPGLLKDIKVSLISKK